MPGSIAKLVQPHKIRRPTLRFLSLLLCLLGGPNLTLRADLCQICGAYANATFVGRDAWTLEPRRFCLSCRDKLQVCAVCRLPTKDTTAVGDGRLLCARDAQLVLWNEREVMRAIYSARRELDRMLARFTTLPDTNVHLTFVDLGQLHNLCQEQVGASGCPTLLGTTRSVRYRNQQWHHDIRILRALPTSQMISVYAHELGHAWLHENVAPGRKLDQAATEGLCELLAYRLMELRGDTGQMARIQRSNYTRGQISLFIRSHQLYDFHPLLEWAKHGQDPLLREGDLDQIRRIAMPPARRSTPKPALIPNTPRSSPASDALTLNGVLSAAGDRRKALVNGTLIAVGETAHVQRGTNTVLVHCKEIGDRHAVLELPTQGTNVVLRMPDSFP